MKKVAIDLTWVRHGKVGGTESSVTNLLSGFEELHSNDIEFYLITARDNTDVFKVFLDGDYYKSIVADTVSASQKKRVFWQNFSLCKMLRTNGIHDCLEPIYCMPFTSVKGIRFYTIIHDLQAIHYPEYFSKARVRWMDFSWKNTVKKAYKVVAISDYVRNDIIKQYHADPNKVVRIYDAINIDINNVASEDVLKKYGVEEKNFYYTVSSLLPHKNLKTIIYAMSELKKRSSDAFLPLLVSGVGGSQQQELMDLVHEQNLDGEIRLTGFVDNSVRNRLYKSCKVFLFPSIFEGFGMPPLEAIAFGTSVITTKETSLPEVTGGICEYVENAKSVREWSSAIIGSARHINNLDKEAVSKLLEQYLPSNISDSYIKLFA